jgi:hypothetical protein
MLQLYSLLALQTAVNAGISHAWCHSSVCRASKLPCTAEVELQATPRQRCLPLSSEAWRDSQQGRQRQAPCQPCDCLPCNRGCAPLTSQHRPHGPASVASQSWPAEGARSCRRTEQRQCTATSTCMLCTGRAEAELCYKCSGSSGSLFSGTVWSPSWFQ